MADIILKMLATFVGVIGLGIFMGVPKRFLVYCGVLGATSWLVNYIFAAFSTDALAALVTTAFVMAASRVLAVRKRCPSSVFLIPGIIPMIPGDRVYWAAFYMVVGEPGPASSYALAAVKIAGAIVLGIVLVSEIPQELFSRLKHRPSREA